MTNSLAGLDPNLAAWIGRRTERTDVITPRLVDAFRATLSPHVAPLSGAPLGIHWCLAPDFVEPQDLGPDGHPRTGLFIPVMPYTRRMWAGGELTFHGAFAVGDTVTKSTTIADIAFKTGSTGKLAFLTIRHDYQVGGDLILAERQDVVYRDADGTGSRTMRPAADASLSVESIRRLTPDPTLLFRYSALTFNGHRIHYDEPYATGVEGYDGLVVHGPLQATLLLNLAASLTGAPPGRFSYRGQAPLVCGEAITVEADAEHGDRRDLRVRSDAGIVTMSAEASLIGNGGPDQRS